MKLVLPNATHSITTAASSRRKRKPRASADTSTIATSASSHGVATTAASAGSQCSRGT